MIRYASYNIHCTIPQQSFLIFCSGVLFSSTHTNTHHLHLHWCRRFYVLACARCRRIFETIASCIRRYLCCKVYNVYSTVFSSLIFWSNRFNAYKSTTFWLKRSSLTRSWRTAPRTWWPLSPTQWNAPQLYPRTPTTWWTSVACKDSR